MHVYFFTSLSFLHLPSFDFKDTTHILLTHGFVPHRNRYDQLALGNATADNFYSLFERSSRFKAASEDDDRHFRAIMVGVLEGMGEEVHLAKGRWEVQPQWRFKEADSPQYDLSDEKPLAVWADGGVDPRLIANLMGLRNYVHHRECECCAICSAYARTVCCSGERDWS